MKVTEGMEMMQNLQVVTLEISIKMNHLLQGGTFWRPVKNIPVRTLFLI